MDTTPYYDWLDILEDLDLLWNCKFTYSFSGWCFSLFEIVVRYIVGTRSLVELPFGMREVQLERNGRIFRGIERHVRCNASFFWIGVCSCR